MTPALVCKRRWNELALREYEAVYRTLGPAESAVLVGPFRGEMVGPRWLRRAAPLGLALGGLGGWWGKEFDGARGAVNVVVRTGAPERVLPMNVCTLPSRIDAREATTLTYDALAPLPWRWVVDELRQLDERTVLGMTIVDVLGLRRLALPFLLHRSERIRGP